MTRHPVPVSEVAAPPPEQFDELVRKALHDDLSWGLLTASEADAQRASQILLEWKRDLKHQRTIAAARLTAGEVSRVDHARWLSRSASFERLVDRRRAGMSAHSHTPPAPTTVGRLRAMNKSRLRTVEALAQGVQDFLAGSADGAHLEELLRTVRVDLGGAGDIPVTDALRHGYFQGVDASHAADE